MILESVYKHAYEGYTHNLNGRSKKAVQSYTKMYKAGLENPTQAKYTIEMANKKANSDYYETTKNSEFKTTMNTLKTFGRTLVDYVFNSEFRKADNAFSEAYNKMYPKTHTIRDAIIAERNMP